MRETTQLLMECTCEDVALLIEEFLLPNPDDCDSTFDIGQLNGTYGHWECAMTSTSADALSHSLIGAIANNEFHMIQPLIALGADLNLALEYAAEYRHLRICDVLIDLGASRIYYVLNVGIINDRIDMVTFAITRGAEPNDSTMQLAGMNASWGIILLIHTLGFRYKNAWMTAVIEGRFDILIKFLTHSNITQITVNRAFAYLCRLEFKTINHYRSMLYFIPYCFEFCFDCYRSPDEHLQEIIDGINLVE